MNTLTSTDNKIKVYEGSGGSALPGTVHYGLDILLDDPTISIFKYAVSYFGPSGPGVGFTQSATLGTNIPVPLLSGTYDKSLWGAVSPIPFETVFGTTDNSFILIGGSTPITSVNDIDGPTGSTFNPNVLGKSHASRGGIPSSNFAAFNGSGQLVASSLVVPEPSVFLSSSLALLSLALRRRRI